jgi:DnaK suppressor protein
MNTWKINKFRRLLEDRKAELLRVMQEHRSPLAIRANGDPVDQAHSVTEREAAVRDLNRETTLLRKVLGALREIEDGTFGRCAACDREIPLKRLEAVPWSPYCVKCQEAAEVQDLKPHVQEAGDATGYAMAS